MTTILRIDGFRFFFFSREHEPIHIHIIKAEKSAKFNLESGKMILNDGFKSDELKFIKKTIKENKKIIKDKWNEYFRNI